MDEFVWGGFVKAKGWIAQFDSSRSTGHWRAGKPLGLLPSVISKGGDCIAVLSQLAIFSQRWLQGSLVGMRMLVRSWMEGREHGIAYVQPR